MESQMDEFMIKDISNSKSSCEGLSSDDNQSKQSLGNSAKNLPQNERNQKNKPRRSSFLSNEHDEEHEDEKSNRSDESCCSHKDIDYE